MSRDASCFGGFEADEPRTSGFFKLQKICTLNKKAVSKHFFIKIMYPQNHFIHKVISHLLAFLGRYVKNLKITKIN